MQYLPEKISSPNPNDDRPLELVLEGVEKRLALKRAGLLRDGVSDEDMVDILIILLWSWYGWSCKHVRKEELIFDHVNMTDCFVFDCLFVFFWLLLNLQLPVCCLLELEECLVATSLKTNMKMKVIIRLI